MEESRFMSAILLIVAIVVVCIASANYIVNIEPKYDYISESENCLEQAQIVPSLEAKLLHINESIAIYETGSSQANLQGLRTLQSLNSTSEIDYWLPKVMNDLSSERNDLRFTYRGMATAVLLVAFMLITGIGTFRDYQKWDTDDQHIYNILVFGLGLATIIGFL